MVFPWLIIGASAALEASRRNAPPDQTERTVKKLQDVEHHLKIKHQQLSGELKEATSDLADEKAAHEEDKSRLQLMEQLQKDIEARMAQLQVMTDELVKENEQLKIENVHLEEEAKHAHKENQELRSETQHLRSRNTELESMVDKIAEDSKDKASRASEMLQELRDAVAEAMSSFTSGGSAIDFQQNMERLGISLDVSLDDLKQISRSSPAREALTDAVNTQFNTQMGLVMENRDRLEQLMGIAQNLHASDASHTLDMPRNGHIPNAIDKPTPLQHAPGRSNSLGIGATLLNAFSFNKDSNKATQRQESILHKGSSSIPAATDVTVIDQELQASLSMNGSGPAIDEVPVTTGPEAVVKKVERGAPKTGFKFGFKGIPNAKKSMDDSVPVTSRAAGSIGDDSMAMGNDLIMR